MMYQNFADIYDRLMQDVDYDNWCSYLCQLWERHHLTPSLVLELGCGTGQMTRRFARKGYSMIGLDLSADMLRVATERAEGEDILYICQDMSDFELYGTVQAVLCTLDGFNYLIEDGQLERCLSLVRLYLEPGGLLIFDLNTPHKIRNIIAPQPFIVEEEGVFYTWESELIVPHLCRYDLSFFVEEEDARYRRFNETHVQRIYSSEEIEAAIQSAGLELVECLEEFSFTPPGPQTERTFYVVRRKN